MGFGGWDGQDVSGKTWRWDETWQAINVTGPPKRAAFAMAYDDAQERVFLFGGLWLHGQYADLWQWQNDTWQQLGGPYDHSSLDHHAMTFDHKRKRTVLFGGKDYRFRPQGLIQAVVDGQLQTLSIAGPPPRHSLALSYDAKRESVFLFGGKLYQGESPVALNDFWRWDGTTWLPMT